MIVLCKPSLLRPQIIIDQGLSLSASLSKHYSLTHPNLSFPEEEEGSEREDERNSVAKFFIRIQHEEQPFICMGPALVSTGARNWQ